MAETATRTMEGIGLMALAVDARERRCASVGAPTPTAGRGRRRKTAASPRNETYRRRIASKSAAQSARYQGILASLVGGMCLKEMMGGTMAPRRAPARRDPRPVRGHRIQGRGRIPAKEYKLGP